MKFELKPQTIFSPVPVVMVSCGTMENPNITTVAWTGIVSSEPPLIYISLRNTRKSYEIIKEQKEFVINFPNENLVWHADFCGTKSGKNIDKFKEANLQKEEAKIVNAPLIKECPINLECKVKEIKSLGSHDMFIAEIININADEKYLENGRIDYGKMNLLSYMGSKYFVNNKEVADRGICLK